jgi:hypothetical protein
MIARFLDLLSERRRARYVGPHDLNTPVGRLMWFMEDKPRIRYTKTLYTIDMAIEIITHPRRAQVLYKEWRSELHA